MAQRARIRADHFVRGVACCLTLCLSVALSGPACAADQPNIVFIMGDDIGWFNVGAYHQGIMAGKTPNLDRLAMMPW